MIRAKVGRHELEWRVCPKGEAGTCTVVVNGRSLTYGWRLGPGGEIALELPDRVVFFDISGAHDDDGHPSFRVTRRDGPGEWGGLRVERAGDSVAQSAGVAAKKGIRVRSQMPGKIISVSVRAGDAVEKDQPLLVMEAMKMENVIRAPQSGRIAQLKVSPGLAVESGADLCSIEST